ncbi:MAG: glycosyltransferase family 4 protein [Oscillospiraceae bacterium]|jgi:glycosyltransferase EpsD|nr:glycosyltransferase family 4 protein [Oscillospiraceae bacterium]
MSTEDGKRILFVATVARHFYYFHQPTFRMLRDAGWAVDAAAAQEADKPLRGCRRCFDLPFARSPLRWNNLKALAQLRRIVREGNYDIIHCHTPVGGLVGRLAARGTDAKVYYTAHGFHFFPGARKRNWLLYYSVERLLAKRTDCLLTVNEEDFALAKRWLPAKELRHIHGVGCDLGRCAPLPEIERKITRKRLGLPPNAPILLCVAELNSNKNQTLLLRAMPAVLVQFPQARLLLAGKDHLNGALRALCVELKIQHAVFFLGERGDVPALLGAADIALAASFREGLPLNVMEAMASALPVVATNARGHRELVVPGETGELVPQNDAAALAREICALLASPERREQLGRAARMRVRSYAIERVLAELRALYFGEDV